MKNAAPADPPSRTWFLAGAVVCALTAIGLFGPSRDGAFLNWDDQWLVVENDERMASSDFVKDALNPRGSRAHLGYEYLPVRDVSYWLDRGDGVDAERYHVTNLVLYALACALLFRLFWEWTGDRVATIAAAAFFVVHPLHVESVAWIAERKGLLALVFVTASLLVLLRWLRRGGWPALAGFLALHLLASGSKSTVHFLPLALLLLVPVAVPGRKERKKAWTRGAIAAAGALAISIVFVLVNAHHQAQASSENAYPGGSLHAAIPIMAFVFVRYAIQLAVPVGLSPDYDVPETFEGVFAAAGVASTLALAALVAFLVFLWVRGHRRGSAAGLFALLALGPVSNLVPLSNQMADRYLLLPSIGVAVAVGLGVAAAGRLWKPSLGVGAAIALVFAGVTVHQISFWKTPLALWKRATAIAPGSARSWVNLGDALLEAGRGDEAVEDFEHAVSVEPDDAFVRIQVSQKLQRLRRLDEAVVHARAAVALSPKSFLAHDQLARLLAIRGDFDPDEVERLFREAMRCADDAGPGHDAERTVARRNLGEFLFKTNRVSEARDVLVEALEFEPEAAERSQIHRLLALLAFQLQDRAAEIHHLERAIADAPETTLDVRVKLAETLLRSEPQTPERQVRALRLLDDTIRLGRGRTDEPSRSAVDSARRLRDEMRRR